MWMPELPHVVVPAATPSQYWLMIVPQLSLVPLRPVKKLCNALAAPAGSDAHCDPQNTRYTFGIGETTPVLALDLTESVLRLGFALGPALWVPACCNLTP